MFSLYKFIKIFRNILQLVINVFVEAIINYIVDCNQEILYYYFITVYKYIFISILQLIYVI